MSEVGVDALVIKVRAVARELNGLLAKLHTEQVNVKVNSFECTRGGAAGERPARVNLTMTFPVEIDE